MDVQYTVRRSDKRRKLTITVERDRSVVVHAPLDATADRIEEIVQSKRHWIQEKIRHPQKYDRLPHPPGKELVNGESALYLGRNYRVELVDDESEHVRFNQRFFIPRSKAAVRKTALLDWYKARAQQVIQPRVMQYAKELGVTYSQIRIVDNQFRWGSCTVKDNVNFNWRLVKAPKFVIDYVIIHELAHLLEANHTPRFWNIIRGQTPKMDQARAWLRENGQLLEQEI